MFASDAWAWVWGDVVHIDVPPLSRRREDIPIPDLYYAKERPVVERDGVLLMVDDERFRLHEGEQPVLRSVRGMRHEGKKIIVVIGAEGGGRDKDKRVVNQWGGTLGGPPQSISNPAGTWNQGCSSRQPMYS